MVIERMVLWDIDGTLVRAGELGAAVFDEAMEAVYGARPAGRVRMSGKTDPQIVSEYLDMTGWDRRRAPEVVAQLAARLAAEEGRLSVEGVALPGAAALVSRLAAADWVVNSILTGNIAPNARVKLRAFGLDPFFDFEAGAYGSDNPDRTALVPLALERLAKRRGVVLDPRQVWVVGDTPRDLACADAAGARCLLVATGRYSLSELSGLGADAVLAGLEDTDGVFALLAGDPVVAPR